MREMKDFLDVIKNLLVICCLIATFCATCRQEQASDRINADLNALQNVCDEMKEAVYYTGLDK